MLARCNTSFTNRMLERQFRTHIEDDPNLSQLPDEFQEIAFQTMIEEHQASMSNGDSKKRKTDHEQEEMSMQD
jgi:hypothetical protein